MARDASLDEAQEAPCARCRRLTAVDSLSLWTTRERLRTLARQAAPSEQPATAAVLPPLREPALTAEPLASRAPPPPAPDAAFRYASRTRVDAVCPDCWGRLSRGAPLDGPDRRRLALACAVVLVVAILIVWGIPAFVPNLVAAFWRNGAGGR